MKISINDPCHENWDAMTPNEKGAFCLSCQKTVVDFSKKTTEEIKSFFSSISKTEKVCGRFKEEQLNELTFDEFFSRFKSWVFPQKLAVILLFVFGLTLFSCKTTKQEPLMGKVAYEKPIDSSSSNNKSVPVKDTVDISMNEMKIGEVAMEPMPEPVKPNLPKTSTPITNTITPKQFKKVKQLKEEETYMKGDVYFEPDTTKKIKCTPKDSIVPEKHIMGMIKKVE